jgi:hypothetical protein
MSPMPECTNNKPILAKKISREVSERRVSISLRLTVASPDLGSLLAIATPKIANENHRGVKTMKSVSGPVSVLIPWSEIMSEEPGDINSEI